MKERNKTTKRKVEKVKLRVELYVAKERVPSLPASTKETKPTGRKQQSRKVIGGRSPPHLKTV